jgi:hypothetical protein
VAGGSVLANDDPTCPSNPALRLDASRGLVTYILDGQVQPARLSDGDDTVAWRRGASPGS